MTVQMWRLNWLNHGVVAVANVGRISFPRERIDETSRATRWWLGAAFGMTILAGPTHSATPQPVEQAVRPTAGVIADWEEAGAVFGWLSIDLSGDWRFDEGEPAAWPAFRDMGFGPREPAVRPWPVFRFNKLPAGKVERLTLPHVPFGLWLGRSVKDADLKALGGLTPLRALSFEGNFAHGVTDAGLKEIAKLTQLQALNLEHTGHTDAGMKELAALKQLRILRLGQLAGAGLKLAGLEHLQSLDMISTSVTNAGMKELVGLNPAHAAAPQLRGDQCGSEAAGRAERVADAKP